jgi:hypothetical protein
MGKGLDTGKAFYQGLLGKITDPEQRAAAEKLLANPTFLTELGNGVEGQSEIDRQLQTLSTQREDLETKQTELSTKEQSLQTWHEELTGWYGDNKALLAAAKTGGKTVTTPTTTVEAPKGMVTEDALRETLGTTQAAFLGFQRDQNRLQREHYGKFGEILDIEPLLLHPQIAQVGLIGAYEQLHKDRLAKHAEDAKKAAEDLIRADERTKVLQGQAQMPYPPVTGAGSGSPLDALAVGKPDSVVDAATAHYQRLQSERSAVTR